MKDIKQIIREELQKVVTEETSMIQKGTEGDCYKNVQDYLLDNEIPNAVIVHGVVTSRNGTLNHAWIETDTEVYDPTTGIKTDKETYYSKLNPKVEAKYTFEEAMKKRFATKNFGPWHTKQSLSEVGEANVSPYTWQKKSERINDGGIFMYVYTFTTEDGDNYITEIQNISNYENKKGSWTISFETSEHDMYQTVNKGRVFGVMSTILNILKDFIKTEDPNEIIIHPTKGSEEKEAGENKRLILYTQYIKKNLPVNYYVASMGTTDFPEIILRKKSRLGFKNSNVNEIVNEELEELLGYKPIHVYEETENFYPLETNVSLVTEKHPSDYNENLLIDEITKIAREENLPTPTTQIDTGSDAMVFETSDPDMVIRAELIDSDESADDMRETILANPDIQETGGVTKIYNIDTYQIGEEQYLISWKEKVDPNFEYVLWRKYGDENAPHILYALHLYNLIYGVREQRQQQLDILKNTEETSKLYDAVMQGLPVTDLAPSSNMGVNNDGYIVAYDC